ncbi:universal stress protein [Oceanicella actignis]|uniref:Nucleotide-binding universal stress protein, UspA family n=1 Tax=Oceanicella actignis TaxID=1189325 RepID=A0A1M7SDS0_9RHOB|nr:universal stress protein [Oceanicella actignis]SET24551.1 Nucleotide-binding universal stress protein, UspA family [Oceanicella actignis]SHN56615.1 Nucleotide-binding universal stress protein, UspA family [Oceanicella actignis]
MSEAPDAHEAPDAPRKLVALVDGSIYSASVCDHAAWTARRAGLAVELVHVLPRPEAPERRDLSGAIRLGARSALLAELAELDARRARLMSRRGRAILDDALAILARDGVTDASARLLQGDLVEAVADAEAHARMIVIGKRGEAADFAKGHLGSNLERVARASRRPVLVASRAFRPIARVLVAHDGGAVAEAAVERMARDPLFAGLEAHVVHVGADAPSMRRMIEGAAALLADAGLKARAELLPGQPEAVLGKLVEERGFDLVVMGAYGHSRIRSLLLGSTTAEMIRSCKAPILLMR